MSESDDDPGQRFRHLPPSMPLDQTVEEQEVDAARDPELGRDPDRDWLLRGS